MVLAKNYELTFKRKMGALGRALRKRKLEANKSRFWCAHEQRKELAFLRGELAFGFEWVSNTWTQFLGGSPKRVWPQFTGKKK